MRIILASKSPRRKEIMEMLDIDFDILVSGADEIIEEGLSVQEQSKRLAYAKAKAVFDETQGDRIVIGSDTMVEKDGILYGKPKDRDEAISMIEKIKNSDHNVITGVSVLIELNGEIEEYTDYDITKVYVKDLSEKEIIKWIDSGEAMDKAGAYAIQGKFGVYIEKIEGNYYSVMGLPINKVHEVLKKYF